MTIRRKDQGPEVLDLQSLLIKVGWNLIPDGDFGLRTEAATRCFQSLNNLVSDGLVGPKTMKKLTSAPTNLYLTDPVTVVLDVPYLSQRDNINKPYGTCNVTSVAMVLSYLGTWNIDGQLEDYLFNLLSSPKAQAHWRQSYKWAIDQGFNPRNVHGMLKWLVEELNYVDEFTTLGFEELFQYLDIKQPLVVTGTFTRSGHIICLVGYTSGGDLIVHDPYGNWETQYQDHDGMFRIYSYQDMIEVLKPPGGSEAYAHIIEDPNAT